ncbi:amidohydrolase family protein [Planktomarina temperata]|nr:amidohydrolase family protein [Planktomarina temperata]
MKLTGANVLMGLGKGRFDGHAHVFEANLPMVYGRRYTPDYDASVQSYASLLQAADLDGGILVQPSFLGSENSFLLQALASANAIDGLSFKGVVVLEPTGASVDLAALNELTKQGIIGLRLNLVGKPDSQLDLGPWDALLRMIDSLGWHVEIHCEGTRLQSVLDGLLTRCERVVVDHFGLPCPKELMKCASQQAILGAQNGRVFVKASAPYRVLPTIPTADAVQTCTPVFKRLIESLGPKQILWGSDWPWTRFENGQTFRQTLDWQEMWLRGF